MFFCVFYYGMEIGMEECVKVYVDYFIFWMMKEWYVKFKLDEVLFILFVLEYVNVVFDKEMIGKLVGGFLLYIFVVFGFMGCMYLVIDLFMGEKECGIIEILLIVLVL